MTMASETRFRARRAGKEFPGPDDAKALCNRLSDPEPPFPHAAAQTLTYKVELITPLFGGGVKPGENDLQLPVRMKALRGQLRFWWRLLAAYGGFKDCCRLDPLTDGHALYEAETARWGGANENGKPIPGRIALHVLNVGGFVEPVAFENCIDEVKKKYETAPVFNSQGKAIEYALFPAKHGEQDGSLPKDLILPTDWPGEKPKEKVSFTLRISVHTGMPPDTNQIGQELRQTVAWWATFGGIGARWRRGAGSVRVHDESDNLLCILDDDPTNTSSLPKWSSDCGTLRSKRFDSDSAKGAWGQAVKRLKAFRQDPGIGRDSSGRFGPFGRSFWPEADLIRDRHGPIPGQVHKPRPQFIGTGAAALVARGAFGLPMGVRFPPRRQREDRDPPGGEFVPVGPKRMASPIILRAVARRNGNFTPCALLLPWWRDALSVPLAADLGGSTSPTTGYRVWPDDPAARAAAAAKIRPISANQPAGTADPDPLSAFMEFFSK